MRYALLTEQQSTFLITLTRNTPVVVEFKAALVDAFDKAKKQLALQHFKVPTNFLEAMELATATLRENQELQLTANTVTKAYVEQTEKVDELKTQVEDLRSAAEKWKELMSANGTFELAVASNIVEPGMGTTTCCRWLRAEGILIEGQSPIPDPPQG